jgi:hypothetical protein
MYTYIAMWLSSIKQLAMNSVFLRGLVVTGSLFTSALMVSGQGNFNLKYENSSVYAGIEVGSKGVKLSVVEVSKNAQYNGAFNPLKDSTINTDFISFTQPTFDATLNGLYNLYSTVTNDYKLSPDAVFTVVSSGVKMQADKENKAAWISNLIDSFRSRVKDEKRKVDVIDIREEARLSHLGIVPEDRRFNTFLIDIGSGNAKGGYFPYGNTSEFKLFQLSWGTKSTANETEKKCTEEDKSLTNFHRQLYKVLLTAENTDIIYAVNSSGAYPMSDNIAFSGGIAWSVATLIHPELIDKSVITVTYDEVAKFSEQIYRNYPSLWAESLSSGITDKSINKTAVAKEIKRVHSVFDQRSLMAGTGLLLKIMRQFRSVTESKQFYLVKNGQVGWISAYVRENTAE